MRKCEELPGARVELLLDLPPNRMGSSERAPFQWRVPLAEKWAAPMPGCLWITESSEFGKQTSQTPHFSLPLSCFQLRQPVLSAGLFIPGLFPSFGSLTQRLGGLGPVPQFRERPRCCLRIQPLGEVSVDPAPSHPILPGLRVPKSRSLGESGWE